MTGGFGFVDPPLIGTDLIEFEDLPGTDLELLPPPLEDEPVVEGREDELALRLEEDRDEEDLEEDERELDFDFDGAFATAVL